MIFGLQDAQFFTIIFFFLEKHYFHVLSTKQDLSGVQLSGAEGKVII